MYTRTLQCIALTVALLAYGAAFGIDGIWTNNAYGSFPWREVGNWTDSQGAPLAAYPGQSAGDTATLNPPVAFESQTVYIDKGAVTLNALSGTRRHTLVFGPNSSFENTVYLTGDTLFTVLDPSGFLGFWQTSQARQVFSLPQDGAAMTSLSTAYRPTIQVPTADTQVSVGDLYGQGALVKTGPGDLVVGATDGPGNTIYVREGTLVLAGESETQLSALLNRAAFHLDATRTDSLSISNGVADGRSYVTRWRDVRGNGIAAVEDNYRGGDGIYLPDSRPPFMCAAASPTGLALVDFGARTESDIAEYGPMYCHLQVSPRITNAREIFYAVQSPKGGASCTIVGDTREYPCVPGENGQMFAGWDASTHKVTYGDICLNGRKVTYREDISALKDLYVASLSTLDDTCVGLLCSTLQQTRFTGGSRIGEFIVFTNELTRTERQRINRHLLSKWKDASLDRQAGPVHLATDAAISVPDGQTARVTDVIADSCLTKKGAGRLSVEVVHGANPAISVEGGHVAFASSSASEGAPAAGAYAWLDATRAGTLESLSFASNPTNYVKGWKDCRADVAVTATCPSNTPPRLPYIVPDAAGEGLDAISFGYRGWANQSHMEFPNLWLKGGSIYAGFMVVRLNDVRNDMPLFGCSTGETLLRDPGQMLSSTWIAPRTASARWTINGVPVDPVAKQAALQQTSDFFVLAFSSEHPVSVDSIAKDREGLDYANNAGGCQVGEMILYKRRLTEAERRDTEAYLMRRWIGKTHPAARKKAISSLTFAAGVEPGVESDAPLSVGTVTADAGVLVKRGGGIVTVGAVKGVQGVSVEQGTLELDLERTLDSFGPIAHFDASDLSRSAYYVSEDGVTNVTVWGSSVNGVRATSCARDGRTDWGAVTNPVIEHVDMGAGLRPVLSFGELVRKAGVASATTAAAMTYSAKLPVREIHMVVADNSEEIDRMNFIYDYSNNKWMRGQNGKLFDTVYGYTSAGILNGYIALDGETGNGATVLPDGFHLVSVAPTESLDANCTAMSAYASAGGLKFGEQLIFDRELTAEERAFVQGYLRHKWFGASAPVWRTDVGSVSVATGASVSLSGGIVQSSAVSGGGTIAANLEGVSSVALDWTDQMAREHLNVGGIVAFAPSVCVRIHAGGARLTEGVYPLLTADGFEGLDFSTWILDADAKVRGVARFARDGETTICLRISAWGSVMVIR